MHFFFTTHPLKKNPVAAEIDISKNLETHSTHIPYHQKGANIQQQHFPFLQRSDITVKVIQLFFSSEKQIAKNGATLQNKNGK